MKTGDFDLGQKMKILNLLIWYDESREGIFFIYRKVASSNASRFVALLVYMHTQNVNFSN
jgi:hypothetical protein